MTDRREWLNNSFKNGATLSTTSFITDTGSGSAAELLSGRWKMAEMTSSTLGGVNNTPHFMTCFLELLA